MGVKSYLMHIVREFRYRFDKFFQFPYYKHIHSTSGLGVNNRIRSAENLVMGDNAYLKMDSVIMNGRARFVMKANSGAAEELMVITGNHLSIVGMNVKQVTNSVKDKYDIHHEMDKDVIVDEDVWIGARVSLLSGVHIGRGCEIGTGAVVRFSVPPYSIVVGDPAKVIGFRFTPEEIIEHEKIQYPEEERLPLDLLQKNYEKYYLSKIKEIRKYLSITF